MRRKFAILFAIVAVTLLVACTADDPTESGSSRVTVLLTDAPLDLSTVSAVNVTFDEFRLWPAGDADGIVMGMPASGSESINLLDFQNGQVTTVATADVPAGEYRRIRLSIVSAELVHDDDGDPATPDVAEEIFVPSSKVDVPVSFRLAAGTGMEITLDFDAQNSVQVNETPGSHPYILRPVIVPVGMRSS